MVTMGSDRVERKLAAILAADVSGYSRLMAADEAGTAQALREHLAAVAPIVASHGGRIVKTAGDGVLMDFLSIVAAIECAEAVQKLMADRNASVPADRRMLFRVGVNLGDVLVDGDDILGDGINVAARLENLAETRRDFDLRGCLSSGLRKSIRPFRRCGRAATQEYRARGPGIPGLARYVVRDGRPPRDDFA